MSLIPLLLAAVPLPPVTAERAIANFHEQYRLARAGNCRSESDPETIVVCGTPLEESPYRIAPSTRVGGYRPPPPGTQLFEFNLGPVRVGCCALSTSNGTGAGLSISTRF